MSLRNHICRLCLKVPPNKFVLIDETTRQGLGVLSVKMNFDVSNDPLMCEDCAEVIKRLLHFILVCLDSDKTILLFDNGQGNTNIDLRDVYAYRSKQIVGGDSNICRFCIIKVEESNFLPLDILMKENMYIFQMDQNVIGNPIICFQCRDNMESHVKFLQSCRDTEEKINMYRQYEGTKIGEKIMLSDVFLQFSESTLNYSNTQVCEVKKEERSMNEVAGIEIGDMYNSIEKVKEECVIIGKGIGNSFLHQNGDSDHIMCTCDTKDSSCLGCQDRANSNPPVVENKKVGTVSLEMSVPFKLESEEFHIKDDVTLNEGPHSMNNVSNFRTCICNEKKNSCNKCSAQFETISTEPILYKCKLCSYQGAWIKSHMLKHRDISEVIMYQCTTCDYETKYQNNVKKHSLTHKPEVEVKTYKCMASDYDTVYKCFKNDLLTHKTEGGVMMYKCTACEYQTKRKKNLERHSLNHKTEAEVIMYKCTACDFKSKHKYRLKTHSLTHQSESEAIMYKCMACDYKTKHRWALKKHSLTHKTEAEVTMYKCNSCDYKTMHKSNLKAHLLFHKPKAELTMYNCTACDFKTKYKGSLQGHSLIHKADTEVTIYNCTVCNFSTKHKGSLQRHMLTHKTEAE